MAFCITQDHVNGPLLAFIGKQDAFLSVRDLGSLGIPSQAVLLSYSETDNVAAWSWLDSSDVQKLVDEASSGTQEDVMDTLQRVFWGQQEGDKADAGTIILMTGDNATRIDRNPKGKGYSPENPAWQFRNIEYQPEAEKLQEDIDAWALREFEAGNPKTIQEIGEHAVDLLKAKGLTGYDVLWAGRIGGEEPVIHEKQF